MLKRKIKWGILATIGYLLSPLAWWTDPFFDIPLAYIVGSLFGLISKKLFLPFMILCYWTTNILGLILIHKGISNISPKKRKYTRKELIKDIIISIIYTSIIAISFLMGWLKLPTEYF